MLLGQGLLRLWNPELPALCNPELARCGPIQQDGSWGPGCRRQLVGGEADGGQGCNLSEEEPFTEGEGRKEAEETPGERDF